MICRNDAPVKIQVLCLRIAGPRLYQEKGNFSQFHADFSDFRALCKQKTSSSFMYTQKRSSSFLKMKILLDDFGYLATFLFVRMNVDLRICGTINSHIPSAEGTIHDFTCFLILGHCLVSSKKIMLYIFSFHSLVVFYVSFLLSIVMCQSKFRLVDDQKAFFKV